MLLNVTLPVRDGAPLLAVNAPRVSALLERHWPGDYELVLVENGSVDDTGAVAEKLARELPATRSVRLRQPGRGGALKHVWSRSAARVLSYMDVDLSTELVGFPVLVQAVAQEGFDLALGSRRLRPATTTRGWRRELLSRGHNALTRRLLRLPVSDAQCGFKALSRRTAEVLLPRVVNDNWFFDTELLAQAAHAGLRIKEIPVAWTENRDSRVRLGATVAEMLAGMWRLRQTTEGGKLRT